ncbi:MAG TPA: hypothetical protein VGM41_17490 [Chitinophagaceae bacterium]|jgi:N-acetylglutamate synthase-like GNAT family acetyltransferase
MNQVIDPINIRKATSLDIAYIRKLPVQLTHPSAERLLPKQLRMMMQVPDHELRVIRQEQRVAAFLAIQFVPARDSAMRFLLIRHLAVDRFALDRGSAAEMEEYATEIASEIACPAVLVRGASLSGSAMKFYRERGYVEEGSVLIKRI